MKIQYLKNQEINRLRYDNALKRSFNANIFAYSWYLDQVCEDWDLLVEGDYETVCPIPLSRKMGIVRVKHPAMAPFLGVFSSKHLPAEKVEDILHKIPFRNVAITLNHLNRLPKYNRKRTVNVPVLDLITPYKKIMERYSEQARDSLSKNDGTFVMRSIRTDEYMFFRRSQKKKGVMEEMQLTRIMNYAIRYKSAGIYATYSSHNELIAAVFLIKSNNRLFLFDCTQSQQGRQHHGVFRAINHLIESNSESNLTLEIPFKCEALQSMILFDHHQCLKYKKGIL
ncbi:hypothetical protein [Marinilabilia sp.]|uniref:hypothetical protein n=1 Tax=Marinilabilia sp. TaxID=2021252 RepID=UPI0025BA70AC|nr:hypothetical protein [Marinilabilia sp.]